MMFLSSVITRIFRSLKHSSVRETLDKPCSPTDTLVSDDIKTSDSSRRDSITLVSSAKPFAIYNGGYECAGGREICLRIANGGAGQTGLIRAWADAFIQHMVARGSEPFEVAWFLGDTTESLAILSAGVVDLALTYNPAAEKLVLDAGDAIESIYAYRDHFLLIGPLSNPANLEDEDDVFTMFAKIVATGNADVIRPPNPVIRPPTRFLSRFDKSATNIKESQIFCTIGQVPWAQNYCKWYHQYPCFPREALEAASLLSEYTLTDLGTWLSAPKDTTSRLRIFKRGSDDANDPLLNPAHLLRGKRASPINEGTCEEFLKWIVAPDGGQKVIECFSKGGQRLYSKAP